MASSPVTAPSSNSSSPPAPPTPTTSPPPNNSSSSSLPPNSSPPSPPQSPPPKGSPQAPEPTPPTTTPPPPPPRKSQPPSSNTSPSLSPPPPPPPPPHTAGALPPPPPPPPEKSPPSNTSSHHSENHVTSHFFDHVNVPLVAGITAGVGILFVIMIVAVICCTKKKRRKPHNPMHYYSDPSGPKGSEYYSSGPPTEWYKGAQDHAIKVPPPPSSVGQPGGGWPPPPPPPPTMMSGSDISSAYSGPHVPALPPPSPPLALGFNKNTFTYDELATATGGFAQSNLLGQGGFGYVYKGVLPNGKDVAVKQLKSGSGQGEREFHAEVDIISRVHHRHLVSLVGYCTTGEQRILVYEFVPNKTLEYHLHGKGLPTMEWSTRLKIALGSARGLAYLHEDCHPKIIHRDIKAANILLDHNFEAMVADFGLAKLSSDNNTHVSTRVMGTFGYLAPEYASSGKLTEKSDVFSYGIMLLELITGRRPVDNTHTFMDDSLVDWARPMLTRALSEREFNDLADQRLKTYNPYEMERLVACAAASVRHSARRRPKMSQIVRALEGDVSLEDLNEGVRPGDSSLFSSSSSYTTNMRSLQRAAMASTEFSNEFSGPTSEYGLNPSDSSSDGAYSEEMIPVGNQRNRPHQPR